MNIHLFHSKIKSNSTITITGSKSETNRLLLLQALFPEIKLKNTSNSDDSEVMLKALAQNPNSSPPLEGLGEAIINVHHAGTAMRFLTAYFAIQPDCEVVLTGSSRMKERPIHILVEALNSLGAQISYEENAGYPPIKIKGTELLKSEVDIEANTSSQYISALLLIAPKLKNGLKINLMGEVTSLPYIQMTLRLLNQIGVKTSFENNTITIQPNTQNSNNSPPLESLSRPVGRLGEEPTTISVESDWSSASYFYSLVALSEIGTTVTLSSFKRNSLQGDAVLAEIYKDFGVKTLFNDNDSITIEKATVHDSFPFGEGWDGAKSPDIAQTIAVTCFGLGLACHLTGLHTLKIKETDRLQALKNELEKLGATISVTDSTLTLSPGSPPSEGLGVAIKTYQDHRMAMAFAPLALKTSLIIEDAEVVSKSYPDFWKDMKTCGIEGEVSI